MQCVCVHSHHRNFNFELFERGFNSDKFLDKLKNELEVYQTNKRRNRLWIDDDILGAQNAAAKEF